MKPNEITQRCCEFASQLDAFLAAVRATASERFVQNITAARRKRTATDSEMIERCIAAGLVTAFCTRHQHGVEPAVTLALALLEDVNAHRLGRFLLEEAKRQGLKI